MKRIDLSHMSDLKLATENEFIYFEARERAMESGKHELFEVFEFYNDIQKELDVGEPIASFGETHTELILIDKNVDKFASITFHHPDAKVNQAYSIAISALSEKYGLGNLFHQLGSSNYKNQQQWEFQGMRIDKVLLEFSSLGTSLENFEKEIHEMVAANMGKWYLAGDVTSRF